MNETATLSTSEPQTTRGVADFSVVYLVYREMLSSIIPSQVVAPLSELSRRVETELVAHVTVGHLLRRNWRKQYDRIKQHTEAKGVQATWLVAPPPRCPWLWSDRRQLRRWLRGRFRRDEQFILHCRGIRMTALALWAAGEFPGARVICDARGDELAEHYATLGFTEAEAHRLNAEQRSIIERVRQCGDFAFTRCDGATAVSRALLQTLSERYGVAWNERSLVIPCCPDVEAFTPWLPRRDAARQNLGVAGKFVVCYLGSLKWYQMPELSLRLYRLIRQLRPDAHFLAITTDPDRMRQVVLQNGIPESEFTIRSVAPDDVPELLIAADAALLIRNQDAVNRAASPVKFGEYLAAGVPVIISSDLGDASELVAQHQLGCVVDVEATDEELTRSLSHFVTFTPDEAEQARHRCRTVACSEMDWDAVNSRRLNFYRRLLELPRVSPPRRPAHS